MFTKFTKVERVAIFSLASIFVFRMLGLFIIIPVFSPYLQTLTHSTPFLIGLTMGIYGLTQVIFQIPFGILSDYIGRKEVITLGLVIFLLGSLVAASSDNIWLVMFGRGLQGAGAISGTLIALLSDLTSYNSRTPAMAIIGVSIGGAFILAFILGPILSSLISIKGIFYLIAILVLPVIYILWGFTPNVPSTANLNNLGNERLDMESSSGFSILFKNRALFKQLVIYSFGIFSLHGILMANFVAVPIILKTMGLTSWQQAKLYIVVFIPAVIFMVPLIIMSEKKQRQKFIIIIAVILLIVSQIIFFLLNNKFWGILLGLIVFFTGFNILEASLPSFVSKLAPKNIKGAVMGFYSTAQFLGPMLGGLLAGVLFKYYSLVTIFAYSLCWAVLLLVSLILVKEHITKI